MIEKPATKAGFVSHLTLSRDGKLLAAAINDRAVHVIDVATGSRRIYTGVESDVASLAFSPDARTLAVGAGDLIKLYDLTRPMPSQTLDTVVAALSVTMDGRFVATAPEDISFKEGQSPQVAVWDMQTGARKRKLLPAPNALSVAMFPDGSRVAPGFENGIVAVARVSDGVQLWQAQGPDRAGFLSLSPDAKLLISGGRGLKDDTVRVWDADTGREVAQLPGKDAVAFSPDGLRVAAASDNKLSIWDSESGDLLLRIDADGRCAALAWIGDRVMAQTSYRQLTVLNGQK